MGSGGAMWVVSWYGSMYAQGRGPVMLDGAGPGTPGAEHSAGSFAIALWSGGVKLTVAAPMRNRAGFAGGRGFGLCRQPGLGLSERVREARRLPSRTLTRTVALRQVASTTRRALAPAWVIERLTERRP